MQCLPGTWISYLSSCLHLLSDEHVFYHTLLFNSLSISFSYVFVLQLLCKAFFFPLVFLWQCFIQSMSGSKELMEWLFSSYCNTGPVRVTSHFFLVSKYWCCLKGDVHLYFLPVTTLKSKLWSYQNIIKCAIFLGESNSQLAK